MMHNLPSNMDSYVRLCRARNHRAMIWINESQHKAIAQTSALLQLYSSENSTTLWIGPGLNTEAEAEAEFDQDRAQSRKHEKPPSSNVLPWPDNIEQVSMPLVKRYLGTEHSNIVFNAHQNFDCDAFAAACGTAPGGALVILITPTQRDWPALDHSEKARVCVEGYTPAKNSLFLQRFRQHLNTACMLVEQPVAKQEKLLLLALRPATLDTQQQQINTLNTIAQSESHQPGHKQQLQSQPNDNPSDFQGNLTHYKAFQDQASLVEILKKACSPALNASPSSCRPIQLLIADRGRGKSAALGMLAAHLAQREGTAAHAPLILSGPGVRATEVLINHFHQHSSGLGEPRFYATDALLREKPAASLLIIDEAAGVPLPVLVELLKIYPNAVLATTIQGYEGAGRGFALRFGNLMKAAGLQTQWHRLHHPIRWATHDPLENFIQASLLTGSVSADRDNSADHHTLVALPESTALEFFAISRQKLLSDEPLLCDIFNLLVQAHYQSKPMDLRHLFDGENLHLFGLRDSNKVWAVAMVALEGPLHETNLGDAIMAKTRRPKGHQLLQLLAQWNLRKQVLHLQLGRIVRIAVEPAAQRRGLGRRLLAGLTQFYENKIDAMGAMYGHNPALNTFWFELGFKPFYLGHRANKSSGERSIAILQSFTRPAADQQLRAQQLFADSHDAWLKRFLPDSPSFTLNAEQDVEIVAAYCCAARAYQDSRSSIKRLCTKNQRLTNLDESAGLAHNSESVRLLSIFSQPPKHQSELAQQLKVSGKKEADKVARAFLSQLISQRKNT